MKKPEHIETVWVTTGIAVSDDPLHPIAGDEGYYRCSLIRPEISRHAVGERRTVKVLHKSPKMVRPFALENIALGLGGGVLKK